MAIRRVTGAVSPSELIFADANALGATYDGSGTTIERGETFTLPAGGTTAVSNGALRLEALKGDCTITNNGNSTLTNASGVDGTIVMRSGASDFPAFVRNSSMGSMSTPAREDFTGSLLGAIFPAGHILQVISHIKSDKQTGNDTSFVNLTGTDQNGSGSIFCVKITPSSTSNKILILCNGVLGMSGQLNRVFIQLVRDSTALSLGDSGTGSGHEVTTAMCSRSDDAGWMQIPFGINFLDSPSSTSELTYKIQIKTSTSSNHFAINSAYNNDANVGNTSTNITVMEVQG